MLEINICIGTACHIKGSYNVMQSFQQLIEEHKLHDRCCLNSKFCLQNCQHGVSVSIGDEIFSVPPEHSREFFVKTVMTKLG